MIVDGRELQVGDEIVNKVTQQKYVVKAIENVPFGGAKCWNLDEDSGPWIAILPEKWEIKSSGIPVGIPITMPKISDGKLAHVHTPVPYYGLSSFVQYEYCSECGEKL